MAPDVSEDARLEANLAGARAAHGRLYGTLEALDDDAVRGPSRLPGWSVGHVLTHIARNADSYVRILQGAQRGEHLEQYAGGVEQRAADIEAGAGRSALELIADVTASAATLDAAWAAMTPPDWSGHGLSGGTAWRCRDLPLSRWREVEVHHVDLGRGYEIEDWPELYVATELPAMLASLPDRLTSGAARRRLLAWLMGRTDSPGELILEPWQSRREYYQRDGR